MRRHLDICGRGHPGHIGHLPELPHQGLARLPGVHEAAVPAVPDVPPERSEQPAAAVTGGQAQQKYLLAHLPASHDLKVIITCC